jgi:DNA helicase-2/ATP-dependent DNA helicase PcrA
LKELDPSVVEFTPCIGGFSGDFSGGMSSGSPFPRNNKAPDFVRKAMAASNRGSSGGSSFGSSGGFSRGSFSKPSVPASIRKNDQRIVYRNPIKVNVAKPAVPSGPRVVYDEYSENPYRPGVRVRHSKYGIGTIVKCYGTGDNARVDVRFGNDNTVRTIILKYAALQIVG